MKSLLPTLKEKKRYLVFEIISESKINDFSDVSRQILSSCSRFIGEQGMAKAGIIVMHDRWNQQTQQGIARVNNKYVDNLKASLALIKNINSEKVIVRSKGVSGILKKAHNKFMN